MPSPAPDRSRPLVSAAHAATLRRWHDAVDEDMRGAGSQHVSYLGRDLVVPEHVFAPAPSSDLPGAAVLDEVRVAIACSTWAGGSVNAILAASRAAEVLGLDINELVTDGLRVTYRTLRLTRA